MKTQQLTTQIKKKKSFLCIGLDVDLNKIPKHLLEEEDPIFAFNKAIIEATHHLCVAYKPNTAFYEAYGIKGWQALEKTINYLNENYPEIYTIADAKRGDIGNTAKKYAEAIFGQLDFDAVTLSPYMGRDVADPFLAYDEKTAILLALTSNEGSRDFQLSKLVNGQHAFEEVLAKSASWGNSENLMYVVGATKPEYFQTVRKHVPDHFLLVPGVGAQGGSLVDVYKNGASTNVGLLVNSSRGIIYAGSGKDFAMKAREKAKILANEMQELMVTVK